MKILLWHVHGGWAESFVRGPHEYLLPTTPERGPWGLGRGGRDWPASAVEIAPKAVASAGVDLVVVQRLEEIAEAERLLKAKLGRDVPAVYVEHNTPKGGVPNSVHPLAERSDIPVIHVTHFNALMWDTGRARTRVVEHGVPDPGPLYSGDLARIGAVVNEPVRRWRVTGSDLLADFAAAAPIDLFGMGGDELPAALDLSPSRMTVIGDVPPARMHAQLAKRRLYVHPFRWTSLGLTLLEAMHLGMPVLALATTEASRAVPPEAGAISHSIDELVAAARTLIDDPDEARKRGRVAREFVLEHYSLPAFLHAWDAVLGDELDRHASRLTPRHTAPHHTPLPRPERVTR